MLVATPEEQYRAAAQGVALLDRSQAGKLAVSGSQAAEFLDALLSNDIASVAVGSGVDAALLTHKGRLLAEVRVLRTEEELLLDTERIALQALFDALHQFQIGYDVKLHKRTLECGLLSLIGPQADDVLTAPPGPAEHDHHADAIARRPVRVIRSALGIDVLCSSEHTAEVGDALAGTGATPIESQTAETIRIERGRPRFGVEIDETTMPQEAGLHERTVSYTKGCYVGQETVARLYWKGKPNRHLRGLRLSERVEPGAELRFGELAVGTLGSFASSPRLGPIGLAMVRREAEPGAILEVGEAPSASATVVELPFGDES